MSKEILLFATITTNANTKVCRPFVPNDPGTPTRIQQVTCAANRR